MYPYGSTEDTPPSFPFTWVLKVTTAAGLLALGRYAIIHGSLERLLDTAPSDRRHWAAESRAERGEMILGRLISLSL